MTASIIDVSVWPGRQAVIPGGVSVPMITPEMAKTCVMDFDGLRQFKSALGTGSMTVIDKDQARSHTRARARTHAHTRGRHIGAVTIIDEDLPRREEGRGGGEGDRGGDSLPQPPPPPLGRI